MVFYRGGGGEHLKWPEVVHISSAYLKHPSTSSELRNVMAARNVSCLSVTSQVLHLMPLQGPAGNSLMW